MRAHRSGQCVVAVDLWVGRGRYRSKGRCRFVVSEPVSHPFHLSARHQPFVWQASNKERRVNMQTTPATSPIRIVRSTTRQPRPISRKTASHLEHCVEAIHGWRFQLESVMETDSTSISVQKPRVTPEARALYRRIGKQHDTLVMWHAAIEESRDTADSDILLGVLEPALDAMYAG